MEISKLVNNNTTAWKHAHSISSTMCSFSLSFYPTNEHECSNKVSIYIYTFNFAAIVWSGYLMCDKLHFK